YVPIYGEARSQGAGFAKAIRAESGGALRAAALHLRDDRGRTAKVKFAARLDYYPFRLKETAPVVRQASRAVEAIGATAKLRIANGGLDANWLMRRKIPTVTLGAGQNGIHTVDEFVDLSEFANGCRLAVALAVVAAGE